MVLTDIFMRVTENRRSHESQTKPAGESLHFISSLQIMYIVRAYKSVTNSTISNVKDLTLLRVSITFLKTICDVKNQSQDVGLTGIFILHSEWRKHNNWTQIQIQNIE